MILSTNFALTVSAIALASSALSTGSLAERDVPYQIYTGDGSVTQGWPAKSEWGDFCTL